MSLVAFILIVVSAGLHASWNLVAKKNRMTIPFYALICTSSMLLLSSCFRDVSAPVRSLTYYSSRGIALASVLWLVSLSMKKSRKDIMDMITSKAWRQGILEPGEITVRILCHCKPLSFCALK